ncbi:MAG: HAMP domain-containing histidine kinase [Lachnospiraceae bacterium]|nr:HAMP domain-containing histidine kinase [Lachnospiraceae bacterium]
MAAAEYPQLYLVRKDGNSSITQYGGSLYRMRWNALYLSRAAERITIFMTAGLILLAIAFLMRKSRRRAVEWIAGVFGKVCLEIKLLLLLVMIVFFVGMSAGALGQIGWWLRNGFSYYNWSGDYIHEMKRLIKAGGYLAIWFWLIYLVVLDFRMNGKRQKKPLFDLLKVKDFKYPIQKRLVRRQRLTVFAELSLIVLFAVGVCVLWLLTEEYMNYLTGGYSYTYDVYEAVAEDLGYPLGLAGGHMAWMLMPCVVFAALFGFTMITFCSLKKNYRLAVDIGALTDQILAVREGNLTEELTLSEETDLREAADNLNQIQKGMETALREQMKSERMKVDLVTNVSHDIKTPLTSIISYAELLRQEEELPQHVKEYIQILGEKAERLRGIVQDVFEISKATSGQLPIQMETLDMGKLLRQTLADMNDRIEESGLTMRTAVPETPVPVVADGQRLYRVFQNLLQNALRYSLPGSRVYLTLTEEGGQAVVRVKNTSVVELADSKDFTERFVRGDESRTDGGSGLGLSIAKSFTEACGGRLTVETDADLFTVTVRFDRAENVSGRGESPLLSPGLSAQGTADSEGKELVSASEKPVMSSEEEPV